MQPYHEKTEAQLVWERIRKQIDQEVNFAADVAKNKLKAKAWAEFEAELIGGRILEYSPHRGEIQQWFWQVAKKELGRGSRPSDS